MLRSAEARPAGAGPAFVPNDMCLACDDAQIALLTGPNMAGQIDLHPPGGPDRPHGPGRLLGAGQAPAAWAWSTGSSRASGASDDLARGNSTFMVEMNETANILNNATDRSLIILDEIGRGTSTYDGLSIAWAVVEHLHRDPARGPRTLFATHYQELTQLEKHLPRLRNFSVAVKEWNDEIVFVRRVVPGAADRSYGIQVARLAGLPLERHRPGEGHPGQLEGDEAQATVSLPAPAAQPKRKISVKAAEDDSQLRLL